MLILSRKEQETILIGDDIRITITRIVGSGRNSQVGIGIQAPVWLRVDREEVRRRIEMEGPQPAA